MTVRPRARRAARAERPKASPAGVVLGIVGGIVAVVVGGFVFRALQGEGGAEVAPADAWRAQSVGDVRVESPVALPAFSDSMGLLPAADHEGIESFRTSQASSSDGNFSVLVTEMVARPGVPLSVEGAAEGAISNAARTVGSLVPIVSKTPVRAGSLEGVRASNVVTTHKPPVHLQCLAVGRDRAVWCVAVIHLGERASVDAVRILDSLRIADAPPAPR